jgi:MFS family permease
VLVAGAFLVAFLTKDPTASGGEAAARPRSRSNPRVFFTALRHRDFTWAFLARVAFMVGHWTISTYQLYTLTDYIGVERLPGEGAASAVALLATLKLGVALATALMAGPLSDRLDRRKVFVIAGSLGVAAGICIPLLWPTWAGMVAYAVVVGFFYGVYLAVDHAIMTLVLPNADDVARDLGLLQIATTGPQVAGPFIAAVVITLGGGYAPLFAFAAVIAAASALLILPIRGVR